MPVVQCSAPLFCPANSTFDPVVVHVTTGPKLCKLKKTRKFEVKKIYLFLESKQINFTQVTTKTKHVLTINWN